MKIKAYHATVAKFDLPFKAYSHFGSLTAALGHLAPDFPQSISIDPQYLEQEMDRILSGGTDGAVLQSEVTRATFKRLTGYIANGEARLFEVTVSMKNPLCFTRQPYKTMIGPMQIANALAESGLMEERELKYIFNYTNSLKADAKVMVTSESALYNISLDKIKMALLKKGHDGLQYLDPLQTDGSPSFLTLFPNQISDVQAVTDAARLYAEIDRLAL